MARRLMVVLALAATAAQAQDAAKVRGAAKGAALPSTKKNAVVAARSVTGPQTSPLSQTSGPRDGGLDAGSVTGEGPWDKFAVCPLPVALLGTDVPAVRIYPAPSSAQTRRPTNGWKQAPFVRAAGRCGNVYIFQIMSRSKDPWSVEHARVERPDGEAVHVNAFRSTRIQWEWDVTVIVAELPPGMNIPTLKVTLTSEDGRAAILEARDLP